MIACLKVKRHNKDEIEESDQTFFIKNGGILLKELIAFCNGRSNPIHHFSAKELREATNNYDERKLFVEDGGSQLYKGFLKERQFSVKKHKNHSIYEAYKNIAIGSQLSVHKNVLKVLGCCLETEQPTVVYEFVGTKSLSSCISATNVQPLPWKCRLKIAIGLANAIAYLHTAFSRPVIYKDIKCSNIILDQNNVPKLTDFGHCISIPEGQSHVKDAIIGRTRIKGFAAPEYLRTGYLTEKVDVYQFGLLLVQLLSGQDVHCINRELNELEGGNHCVEKLSKVIDPRIANEGIEPKQLLDFATLFLRCISHDRENRPTMIEVAKELRRIDQSFPITLLA